MWLVAELYRRSMISCCWRIEIRAFIVTWSQFRTVMWLLLLRRMWSWSLRRSSCQNTRHSSKYEWEFLRTTIDNSTHNSNDFVCCLTRYCLLSVLAADSASKLSLPSARTALLTFSQWKIYTAGITYLQSWIRVGFCVNPHSCLNQDEIYQSGVECYLIRSCSRSWNFKVRLLPRNQDEDGDLVSWPRLGTWISRLLLARDSRPRAKQRKVSSIWHENYINYSNTTKNNTVYQRFGFMLEAFIRHVILVVLE